MAYSDASIANLALIRIGARGNIASLDENSPNAVKVKSCWDHVFQTVLSERDWRFAKTRVELQLSSTAPLYGYTNAWTLPADFLRFVRPHVRPPDTNWYAWLWGPEGWGYYHREDPPFWPTGWPYVCETLPADGTKVILTDYDGVSCGAAKINYIRLITDYSQLVPAFVECLAFRLAAELAIGITEDRAKAESMTQMYRDTLNSAEAVNASLDFSKDETGSRTWELAGRCLRW